MTIQVNISRAKATLSELVALAEAGEDVVLARAGKPVAVIRATLATRPKVVIGALAHRGPLPDDEATLFLGPDPEMEQLARSADEDGFYR